MASSDPRRSGPASLIALLVVLSLTAGLPMDPVQGSDVTELEWGTDIRLSESTETSDDPTIALMPDGGMVTAWRERLTGRYSVFFAILNETGSIVGQRTQLGENLSASMDPAVAVDSEGRLHFVWTAMEDQELWYARAGRDGSIENGPLRLTDAVRDSAEVSIWMDNRDHLHLVWFDGREGTTNLYYMQLDREGRKVVADTSLVRARTEQESAIVMDSRGDLHVLWNGPAPLTQIQWNYELHYSKVSTKGEVLVSDRQVATSRGTIGFPDVALDLANRLHVVWPEGVSVRERLMYCMLDSSGRTLESPKELAGDVASPARDVSVAADGNDRLHLVWSEGMTIGSEIMYMTMSPGGQTEGDPVQLTDTRLDSSEPTIGLSRKGEPRVVWSDQRSGNAEVYLKVATLPREGMDLAVYSRDITFEPPTVIAGEEFQLVVEVHNHGDAVVVQADVHFRLDGGPLGAATVLNVPGGGSQRISIPVTLVEGEHTFSATVDPYDHVAETVEHNNEASRAVYVYPQELMTADAGPDVEVRAGDRVYLDASGTVYRGEGVLSYDWDFGDGTSGTGLYVEHTYTIAGVHTVSLRVSDGTVEDSDTCAVTVWPRDDPPNAVILPPGHITADRLRPVRMTADASVDDHGVRNASWDLGDGTTADTMTVDHLYTTTGIFVVTLTVTDSIGQIDINKTTIEVVNLPPEVGPINSLKKVMVDEATSFEVTASDSDGEIVEVGWDFDPSNGITFEMTGNPVTHPFTRAGTYNVTCIVRDDDGGQAVAYLEVTVEDPGRWGMPGPGLSLTLLAVALVGLAVRRMRVSRS